MAEFIVKETGYPGVVRQEVVGELVRCKDCVHCADDWNDSQPMFTCELGRCGESVQPNDFCSYAEREEDG